MNTYFPAGSVDFARESLEVLGISCDQSDTISVFREQSAIIQTRLHTHTRVHPTSPRQVTGRMLTQRTRRRLQVRGEYKEAASRD